MHRRDVFQHGHVLLAPIPVLLYVVTGDLAAFEVAWCAVAMTHVTLGRPGTLTGATALNAIALLAVGLVVSPIVSVLFAEAVLLGVALLAFAMARHLGRVHERLASEARAAADIRVARDAAKRGEREREQRLHDVVNNLPEGVLVVGRQGQLQLANASAARMLGTAAPDALWRMKPEGATSWHGGLPFSDVLRTGRSIEGFATEVETGTGRRLLNADLVPLGRPEAADAAVLIVLTDVTERRRDESELERTRRQLAHAERKNAVGSLTSGVFHEIRTPLTYITNSLNLARFKLARALRGEADLEKAANDAIDQMAEALDGASRINRLVSELRQFTKPPTEARAPARLVTVLEEAIRLFRATHPGATIVDARLDADPTCVVDRVSIQQLVLNLLENAQEAMGGHGTILVRLRQTPHSAEFTVQDEGPGIPKELHTRIFDEFYTTKPQGTGIGLNIVRRIVEAHGGSIRVEGNPGKGARFVVTLPVMGAREAPVATAASA